MVTVGSIVIRVGDLERQAQFWEAVLDYERKIDRPGDFVLLASRNESGPNLSLDQVPPNGRLPPFRPRLHLDLYSDDQVGEVERLVKLGASEVEWDKRPDDADYVILADPEGNRFCVVDTSR